MKLKFIDHLRKDRKATILSVTVVLIFVLTYYYFNDDFLISNTIDGIHFGIYFMGLGIVAALLMVFILAKFFERKYFTTVVQIGIIMIPFMIVFKVGYQINERFGADGKITMTAKVTKMRRAALLPIYEININNREIKGLQVSKDLWDRLNVGDSIVFKSKQGYFGYKIISEIEKIEEK